tara:strand:- start:314 stop:871 length:558 start_codon:yes stop_codon:yes gene_type:complete
MREVYAIQYSSYLTNAGEFLSSFIRKHSGFGDTKTLLTTHTLLQDHGNQSQSHTTTIIVPFIHLHFRERMIKSWEQLEGFDVKVATYEFDKQYRMINDYLYDTGHKHGNPYKDFRDERLSSRHCSCKLEFVDIGRLLMYNDSEYDKLVKTLNTEPLSRKDTPCCNSWKEYIEQYINHQMIVNRKV